MGIVNVDFPIHLPAGLAARGGPYFVAVDGDAGEGWLGENVEIRRCETLDEAVELLARGWDPDDGSDDPADEEILEVIEVEGWSDCWVRFWGSGHVGDEEIERAIRPLTLDQVHVSRPGQNPGNETWIEPAVPVLAARLAPAEGREGGEPHERRVWPRPGRRPADDVLTADTLLVEMTELDNQCDTEPCSKLRPLDWIHDWNGRYDVDVPPDSPDDADHREPAWTLWPAGIDAADDPARFQAGLDLIARWCLEQVDEARGWSVRRDDDRVVVTAPLPARPHDDCPHWLAVVPPRPVDAWESAWDARQGGRVAELHIKASRADARAHFGRGELDDVHVWPVTARLAAAVEDPAREPTIRDDCAVHAHIVELEDGRLDFDDADVYVAVTSQDYRDRHGSTENDGVIWGSGHSAEEALLDAEEWWEDEAGDDLEAFEATPRLFRAVRDRGGDVGFVELEDGTLDLAEAAEAA